DGTGTVGAELVDGVVEVFGATRLVLPQAPRVRPRIAIIAYAGSLKVFMFFSSFTLTSPRAVGRTEGFHVETFRKPCAIRLVFGVSGGKAWSCGDLGKGPPREGGAVR